SSAPSAAPRPRSTATSPRGTTAMPWWNGKYRDERRALSVPARRRVSAEPLPLRAEVGRRVPRALSRRRESGHGRARRRRGQPGGAARRRPRRARRARRASISGLHGRPSPPHGARDGNIRVFLNVGGPDMAPHTPQTLVAPRGTRGAPRSPHTPQTLVAPRGTRGAP